MLENLAAQIDAFQQRDLAHQQERQAQAVSAQLRAGNAVHRSPREGRVEVSWSDLGKQGKVDAVVAMLTAEPSLSYAAIAERLGTTPQAVGGVVFRAGRTRLYSTTREIHPNAHPVVKSIFQRAYNMGLSDADLAKRSGYAMETIWVIRTAGRGSKLLTLSDLADVVGLELVARAKV